MPFLMVCLVGLLVSVDASPVSSPMIEGQVRLSNGSPVAGAQVVLFDVADLRRGPVGQATTGEAGKFVLPLAAGGGFVLPSEVGLGQNYPNPFNPSTLIPYQLSAPSPVRLEVFNILGQRVATLVDEAQSAGAYQARWDGTDAAGRAAASGVYFYRLTVAGAHWTGKMVLVDGQAGVPLGGASVAAVSMVEGSSGTYGLVVLGEGLVTYVDSDFVVAAGQGPVELEVAAEPNGRGKVVATLEGILGDVDNNGRVDMDDGLLVAMLSVDPALSLPRHGLMTLGDVNCDGRVELADAALLATYVANPSDPEVSSLRIGQRGGYSLDPVTEVVWGSILGTEQSDATVARILDGVPVLLSGVLSVGIDGEDRVYLGIDRAYWTQQGGKQLYEALKQRFPATPIHVEPSVGVIPLSGKVATRPTTTALRKVAPVTRFGPPMSFADSPNAALSDNSKAPKVVGSITVPDDVMVGSVSVAVDITHPSRGDLKIDLVAPSGVVVPLYNGIRRGVDLADNITGTIATTDALQGQRAQGTWQLRVGDYEQGDAGTLNAWNLTVTPAQETPATEEPVNLFLETFQDGLDAWRTTEWEAASLDTDSGVPGEGPGNIVAKAEGCSVCFLTLNTPVDLSAHDSVTLSFYRWLDPGMSNSEFLGVDIGNNGSYQRLQSWSGQHADGEWHLETFTLTGDQISDSFTLRFFGIAQNNFTTVAIDNVMIAATPGSVVIAPETTPDLAVTQTALSQTVAERGAALTVQTTIQNTRAPAGTRTVQVYRHTAPTDTPRQGGTIVSVVGAAVQTDATRTVQTTTTAPREPGTYYYYSCVSTFEGEEDTTNNCTATPATLTVRTAPTTGSDLTVRYAVTPKETVEAGASIIFYPRTTNRGTAEAPASTIRVYRHTTQTSTPRTGGVQETTAQTRTLAPGRGTIIVLRTTAPTAGTYFYYLCVDTVANETQTDNNCSEPATITVQGEEEEETPQEASDLSVGVATASPTTVQSTDTVTIQATVRNTGTTAPATTVRIYRHRARTNTPRTGGTRETNTATTTTLASNRSVRITSTHEAPTVTSTTTYYYYVCVDTVTNETQTDNNCSTPARVTVQPKPEEVVVDLSALPMGGDVLLASKPDGHLFARGTVTLAGLETTTGVPGFVTSAHVVAPTNPDQTEDFTAGLNTLARDRFGDLFGKVYKMPKIEKRTLEGIWSAPLRLDRFGCEYFRFPNRGEYS